MKRIIIGITGASGSIYSIRIIEELCSSGCEVHIICSETGTKVFEFETGMTINTFIKKLRSFQPVPSLHSNSDLFAPPASGSFRADAMVLIPASMASLGAIAAGSLQSLIGRSADVCLKERRKLIIVPRETPLSRIHLKNMIDLTDAGAVILPATPGFYNNPETVDDIVNFTVTRVLDQLGIENNISERWEGR